MDGIAVPAGTKIRTSPKVARGIFYAKDFKLSGDGWVSLHTVPEAEKDAIKEKCTTGTVGFEMVKGFPVAQKCDRRETNFVELIENVLASSIDGWGLILDCDGNEIPYTADNALMALQSDEEFFRFVNEAYNAMQKAEDEEKKGQAGN